MANNNSNIYATTTINIAITATSTTFTTATATTTSANKLYTHQKVFINSLTPSRNEQCFQNPSSAQHHEWRTQGE